MVKLNINNNNNNYDTNCGLLNPLEKKIAEEAPKNYFPLLFATGITSLIIGILAIQFPIIDIILRIKLEHASGLLPVFKWWKNPPVNVMLNVYIFEAENADEFLYGSDTKIKLREIGPIIYREKVTHNDIVYNDNSTLSYTSERFLEFFESDNEPGILNRTILVPNFALLASAARLHDQPFFVKIAFNMLHDHCGESLFLNTTIYNYLWNYRSELLVKAKQLVPFMVPTNDCSILHAIYKNFKDIYNVKIGKKYGNEEFFQIATINGKPTVPDFDTSNGDCDASIVSSTEGLMYRQRITRDSDLLYWRKTPCRPVRLVYSEDVQKDNIIGYKFVAEPNVFDRYENKTADCYKGLNMNLPNGYSDVSKCYFDLPFVCSNPHLYDKPELIEQGKFEGFQPDAKKHMSYTIIEPTFGVPLEQCARSQSSIVMPELKGFRDEYQRFSNMTVPLFWMGYCLHELTPLMLFLIGLAVNVLPIFQILLNALLVTLGLGLILLAIINYSARRQVSRKKNFISK